MAGTCKRQSELLESGTGELSLLPLFLDLKGNLLEPVLVPPECRHCQRALPVLGADRHLAA